MNQLKKKKVRSIRDLIESNEWLEKLDKATKYVTTEHQSFGLILAEKLNDRKRAPMYIRLAKEEYRPILEKALSFVVDYPKAKSKSALFMWKLKELRAERDTKEKEREAQHINDKLTLAI